MVVDIENAIFNQVATAYDASFPNGSRYSEAVETPANFPALILYQEDKASSGYTNLPADKITLAVEVYSNLISGGKQQCKSIMELVRNTLNGFGKWELVFENQIRNADERIYRMRARYRGIAVQESETTDETTVRIYKN